MEAHSISAEWWQKKGKRAARWGGGPLIPA